MTTNRRKAKKQLRSIEPNRLNEVSGGWDWPWNWEEPEREGTPEVYLCGVNPERWCQPLAK